MKSSSSIIFHILVLGCLRKTAFVVPNLTGRYAIVASPHCKRDWKDFLASHSSLIRSSIQLRPQTTGWALQQGEHGLLCIRIISLQLLLSDRLKGCLS